MAVKIATTNTKVTAKATTVHRTAAGKTAAAIIARTMIVDDPVPENEINNPARRRTRPIRDPTTNTLTVDTANSSPQRSPQPS
jgi:hypothetical protein